MTLNVLFLAAEAEPFIKIGGLGDVACALPDAIHRISKELPQNEKIDIRLVLPFHFAIKQKGYKPEFLGEFDIINLKETVSCQVYQDEKDGIPVYFLDGDPIDEKSPVYSPDPILDGYKFVFFSVASLMLAKFLNWHVDILQANDWHTATAIYALKKGQYSNKYIAYARTLHTLHNLPYMGFGVQQALSDYNLPPVTDKTLPEWARHTPLPLGLLFADKIVAVSPHYAEEILTPEFGCGLEDFLNTCESKIDGILNGLDTDVWDPETDPHITQNFSADSLAFRRINKESIQSEFNLLKREDIPLLTLVSRMDPQKGIDIALRGLRHCDNLPWQAILLGTGNPMVEEMAKKLEADYPDRVRAVIDFDSRLAHQLYASADMFMMPSRYEPCGLSQMIAMRYGCVPIARATGGLVDTIQHISHSINGGTGFLFDRPYPSVFAHTIQRAIRLFAHKEKWHRVQLNGMKVDYSWENSAHKYIETYQELMNS